MVLLAGQLVNQKHFFRAAVPNKVRWRFYVESFAILVCQLLEMNIIHFASGNVAKISPGGSTKIHGSKFHQDSSTSETEMLQPV